MLNTKESGSEITFFPFGARMAQPGYTVKYNPKPPATQQKEQGRR